MSGSQAALLSAAAEEFAKHGLQGTGIHAEMLSPVLRKLYQHGQHQGVFPAGRPFELAYAVVAGAVMGMVVAQPVAEAMAAEVQEQIISRSSTTCWTE